MLEAGIARFRNPADINEVVGVGILRRIVPEIKGKACNLKIGVNLFAVLGIFRPEICDFRVDFIKLRRQLFFLGVELRKNFFRCTCRKRNTDSVKIERSKNSVNLVYLRSRSGINAPMAFFVNRRFKKNEKIVVFVCFELGVAVLGNTAEANLQKFAGEKLLNRNINSDEMVELLRRRFNLLQLVGNFGSFCKAFRKLLLEGVDVVEFV